MKYELKRLEPLRLANVVAIIYGALTFAFSLLFSPIFLLIAVFSPANEFGIAGPLFAILLILVYPIMAIIIGWISGLLSGVVYNLAVRLTGGLLLEFDSLGTGSEGSA